MSSDVSNIVAAQPVAAGSLHRAPVGTALPTDSRTALPVAWKDLGYVGEGGFTQSEARATDKKYAFGGDVVKVIQKSYAVTVKFEFLESINAEVLKAVYGEENVHIGTALDVNEIVVKKNKRPGDHAPWVIDVLDGDVVQRTVVPDGQITEVADIKKVHSDVISYTVTMECFPDASGDNVIEYTGIGAAVAPGP